LLIYKTLPTYKNALNNEGHVFLLFSNQSVIQSIKIKLTKKQENKKNVIRIDDNIIEIKEVK